jgi:hypothetical protein
MVEAPVLSVSVSATDSLVSNFVSDVSDHAGSCFEGSELHAGAVDPSDGRSHPFDM